MNKNLSYNIALDCIDKHAQSLHNKHKVAMIYVGSPSPQPSPARGEGVQKITYSNLEGLTNRIANGLRELGVQLGERLILRLPNCPEFAVSFLGAVKAGVIPIPTSPLLTWPELEFMLEDSEASVLVTTEEFLPKEVFEKRRVLKQILIVSQKKSPSPSPSPARGEGNPGLVSSPSRERLTVNRWQDLLKSSSPVFQTENTPADAPAYWLYTSGTEGKPKAVIHSHQSIRAHDARAKVWQDVKSGDVIFNTSALNWSYALTAGLLDVWRHGLTSLVYSGDLHSEKICELIQKYSVTTFMSVPGIYRRLVSNPSIPTLDLKGRVREGFRHVRVCLSAGEKLSEEVRNHFLKTTGLEIYEGLGMTEHSVYLVQRYDEPIVPGSCGKPLPDQRVAILREDLTEASPDEIGVLASHRSCEGLMLGYKEDLSPPLFLRQTQDRLFVRRGNEGGDWFLSGDLAYRDEDGNFFFVGRRDDVITAGGYRISPLEVEAVLNQSELVCESAVVGRELEPGKTIVTAFVVLNPKTAADEAEATKQKLILHAEKNLAKYKIPRELFFLNELPKTRNGKIKRRTFTQKD